MTKSTGSVIIHDRKHWPRHYTWPKALVQSLYKTKRID